MLSLSICTIFLLLALNVQHTGHASLDARTRSVVPGADYPQQDGGSDDRLFQYRSMWLEGYQIINHSEVLKVIKVARDSNINCLTPLINAHSLGTFYNSSFHPRYRDLDWYFDPLMDLIREAHKYNIHVMPWFHTMIDYHAIRAHPEWAQVSSSGSRSTGWLNPALPEVQKYLKAVVYQLFRDYPLDGIHLDACRYPSSSYGYDAFSLQLYETEGWTDFNAFRREQITKCMISIYDSISSIRPYAWIGADIGSSSSTRQNSWFQDTENWSQMGKIDFVTPMIYTTNGNSLESLLVDNIIRHSCPVVCGNYVYVPEDPYYGTVPDEETGMAILQNQTERAIKVGALGTCFFAYKFLSDHPYYHRSLREGVFSEKGLCPLKEQTVPVIGNEWNFDNDQDREGWRVTGMGNQFPLDGVWSISNVREPKLMSPLLDITAPEVNVLELSMRADSEEGNVTVFWSDSETVFDAENSFTFQVIGNRDWNLYSIHLDRSNKWSGNIAYVRIVPNFRESTNITIDLIRITWMPDCIKSWAYLGPFVTGSNEGLLDREFIGNETNIRPRLGEMTGGREWMRYWIERDQVDLRFVLGHVKDAVSYSHVYIRSDGDRIVEMRHGNSDGTRIMLNGVEVYHFDGIRSVAPDQNITYVSLNKGINSLLIKQVVYDDDNSFYMRFTGFGNSSIEGLEYFVELPMLPPPVITSDVRDWYGSGDIEILWEPPIERTGFSHYVWTMDQGPSVVSRQEEANIEDLSDGVHTFSVWCVDDLGYAGEVTGITIRIDTKDPMISAPFSTEDIVKKPSICWKWSVMIIPPSGISHYLVTVENHRRESNETFISVEDQRVDSNRYTLADNLRDGYMYAIRVEAVSGSGRTFEVSSESDVLLDLTPPSRPGSVNLLHIRPGSTSYILKWAPSNENTEGGIQYYEIWWRPEGEEWSVLDRTEGTNISVQRPLGKSIELKVRAKDLSSHHSDFCDPVSTENLAPSPLIILEEDPVSGNSMNFKTRRIIDPDGIITEYAWHVNGRFVSSMENLDITLFSGIYEISLNVTDDQGGYGSDKVNILVRDGNVSKLNSTINGWLMTTSIVTEEFPPIEMHRYDNRTIVIERNETEDLGRLMKEYLMNSMLLMTAVPLVITILIILLFLLIGELKGLRSEQETFIIEQGDEESYVESRKSQLKGFMEEQSIMAGRRSRTMKTQPGSSSGIRMDRPGFPSSTAPSMISKALEVIDQIIDEEWEEVDWDEDVEEWEEME
ncbi:MAG: family 10 glycosylhydrolase [Thermoplasmatota archaeon]